MKDLFVITVLVICSCALISVALDSKTVEVQHGENITLSCSNISKAETQTDWFRVVNGTKASCISSMYNSGSPPAYCSGFKSGKFGMSSNITEVFLTIKHVDCNDSGLYFCGFFLKSNIVLGETIYLRVEDPTIQAGKVDFQAQHKFSEINLLVIILGSFCAVFAVVAIALVIRIVKLQKANNVLQAGKNETLSDDLHYAALNIQATKRQETSQRQMDPQVIYSSSR